MDQKLERRHAMDRERDQAIEDLLGPEQWQAYNKLMDEFRRTEMDRNVRPWSTTPTSAARRCSSDEQKAQWDQMRQARRDRGDGHDRRRHGGSGSSGNREPTTQRAKPDDAGSGRLIRMISNTSQTTLGTNPHELL